MATFSDMLVYLRKRDGLSQAQLAEKTGLTRSAIGMYETGRREPDFETLEVFADFFNVNMDTLLGKESTHDGPTPVTESGQSVNIVKIAGRDGSYMEKQLGDKELQTLKSFIDLLPDASDDL